MHRGLQNFSFGPPTGHSQELGVILGYVVGAPKALPPTPNWTPQVPSGGPNLIFRVRQPFPTWERQPISDVIVDDNTHILILDDAKNMHANNMEYVGMSQTIMMKRGEANLLE